MPVFCALIFKIIFNVMPYKAEIKFNNCPGHIMVQLVRDNTKKNDNTKKS